MGLKALLLCPEVSADALRGIILLILVFPVYGLKAVNLNARRPEWSKKHCDLII